MKANLNILAAIAVILLSASTGANAASPSPTPYPTGPRTGQQRPPNKSVNNGNIRTTKPVQENPYYPGSNAAR